MPTLDREADEARGLPLLLTNLKDGSSRRCLTDATCERPSKPRSWCDSVRDVNDKESNDAETLCQVSGHAVISVMHQIIGSV